MTKAPHGKPVYGVLGYPARHSLSPLMHRAAFTALGMEAEYRIFEVAPEKLTAFLDDARRSLRGFNVTIPYKEQVIPSLDYISPEARLIGAVNTVKVKDSRLEGFNTDGQGFLDDLAEKGCPTAARKVCVVGAGGASRAVCFAIAGTSPEELAVFNRDNRKAANLVSHLAARFPGVRFRNAASVKELGIGDARLLVNATSLGMKEEDPLPVETGWLHPGLFVYDLVYAPHETRLVAAAREKGLKAASGRGMLLRQGMRSFEIWTGVVPPRAPMERALQTREGADA